MRGDLEDRGALLQPHRSEPCPLVPHGISPAADELRGDLRAGVGGQVDVLVSPTTPTVAFKIGERMQDPVAMYLSDLATIPSNLYGGPAMSLPCGLSEGLPVGLQIMAPTLRDDLLYQVGAAFEAALPAPVPTLDWESTS